MEDYLNRQPRDVKMNFYGQTNFKKYQRFADQA